MNTADDDMIIEDESSEVAGGEEVERIVNVGDEIGEIRSGNENEENKENQSVKPKRSVLNPRPKLNADSLKGSKGLKVLPDLFSRVKFKGKGHEEEDLCKLLKTYEYWCHRLFPKCPFDECIDRLERLGSKRPVMTYMKRMRMGIILDDEPVLRSDDDDIMPLEDSPNDVPASSAFDDLIRESEQADETYLGPPDLSEEQQEIIRINKERALKLRQEKLKIAKEKDTANLVTKSVANTDVASPSGNYFADSVSIYTVGTTEMNTVDNESYCKNVDINREYAESEAGTSSSLSKGESDSVTYQKSRRTILDIDSEDEEICRSGTMAVDEVPADKSLSLKNNRRSSKRVILDSDSDDQMEVVRADKRSPSGNVTPEITKSQRKILLHTHSNNDYISRNNENALIPNNEQAPEDTNTLISTITSNTSEVPKVADNIAKSSQVLLTNIAGNGIDLVVNSQKNVNTEFNSTSKRMSSSGTPLQKDNELIISKCSEILNPKQIIPDTNITISGGIVTEAATSKEYQDPIKINELNVIKVPSAIPIENFNFDDDFDDALVEVVNALETSENFAPKSFYGMKTVHAKPVEVVKYLPNKSLKQTDNKISNNGAFVDLEDVLQEIEDSEDL